MFATRRCLTAALGSEKPVAHFSDKIVRTKLASKYYAHPTYVMTREKLLNNMWKQHLIFKVSAYTLVPFYGITKLFQA